jgi:hypothetical protein
LIGAAEDHVVDVLGGDLATLEKGSNDGSRQVIGSDPRQDASSTTDWRAESGGDEGVMRQVGGINHEYLPPLAH